ncbi:MAG: hypothetical protein ACREGB_02230 [Candidatus Saccharimonadales bacterium]
MNALTSKLSKFLSSELFFRLIVALLVLEAGWIAIGARYPQAFDEQFHFGLIQLHAQHLWPLLTSQPPGTESLGAYTRDPSFLYHYLFSFPYRLLTHITSNVTAQIIVLRLMNVALFAYALVLIRKVLHYSSASRAMIHTSLLFFVLIPVVPMLAAEINYDNLFILLISLAFIWCLEFRAAKEFDIKLAIQLVLLAIFTSMVKYAFLPVFMMIGLYIVYKFVRKRPRNPLKSLLAISRPLLVLYAILLVVGGGFFVERYGINMLRYYSPIPECDQVLTVDRCQSYGPWARNYRLVNLHNTLTKHQVFFYPFQWLCRMMQEMTFAISSGFNGNGGVDYWTADSLLGAKVMAWTVLCVGAIAIACTLRKLRKEPVLQLLVLLGGGYTVALYAQNYRDYLHVTYIVAVHGRYLLPFVPMLLLAVLLACRHVLQYRPLIRLNNPQFKLCVVVVAAALFVSQGGGDVTYIVRSESRWFWPQNHTIQHINADMQRALKPLIIDD